MASSQLIHAGGAAASSAQLLLLDPWHHGLSILRAAFERWTRLDLAQIGSLIALASAAPTAWRFAAHVWREAGAHLRDLFVASVTLPGGDPANRAVVRWLLAERPRGCRGFTGRTDVGRGGSEAAGDRAAGLKKTRFPVMYWPHWRARWFWHEGTLFMALRSGDGSGNGSITVAADPTYDGAGAEELRLSCLGRSISPIKGLIEGARDWADAQTQFFVVVYARDRYGLAWQPRARKPLRALDSVHLDEGVKRALLADVRKYLDPRTRRRYQSRSMPYRRGYLFYGPPGTGKSSLSAALAGEFGLDLYEVKVPSVGSDADLEQMFAELPPRCIVLLEDIDAVWIGGGEQRAGSPDGQHLHQPHAAHSHSYYGTSDAGSTTTTAAGQQRSNCTLSGLLNVLDGVGSQEGRIVVMTTNKPDQLDGALIRPGRVDMKVFLGNISPRSARDMFLRMFSPELLLSPNSSNGGVEGGGEEDDKKETAEEEVIGGEELAALADAFAGFIPEDALTPSQLQGYFQLHLDSPREAVAHIEAWVDREVLLKAATQSEFQLVVSSEGQDPGGG